MSRTKRWKVSVMVMRAGGRSVSWRRLAVLAVIVAASACKSDPVTPPPPPPPPPTGALSVTATNLPGGGASAEITPPSGAAQVVQLPYSQGNLPTGNYTIRGREVEQLPTTYKPTQPAVTAAVQAGQTTSATVAYQPIGPRLTAAASGTPGGRAPPWSYRRDGQTGFGTLLGPSTVLDDLTPGTYLIRAGAMLEGSTVFLPSVASFTAQIAAGVNQRINVAWSGSGTITDLGLGTPVAGLTLTTGQSRVFRIPVPSGATELRVTLGGGTGNTDLYLRPDSLPGFPNGVACAAENPGNAEECVVPNPKAGPWYVYLTAVEAVGGLSINATTPLPSTQYRLSILAGAGSVGGVVTSSPSGINCTISAAGQPAPTGCAADFTANTVVRLTPSGVNSLKSWDSACTNVPPTSPCDVTMAADQAVVATFEPPKPQIQVVSSLKRSAVGAIDPTTSFVIPIANAGGGDLRIKPLAPPQLNRGTGWLAASVQYVGPTTSTLVLDVAPDKLRPLGRADFTARLVLEAEGSGQQVTVDFAIRPLVNTTPVLANRVVYFHYEPQNPLPELRTLLPFLGRNGQPLPASQVQFQQSANNWIKDVTVDGATISMVTRAVDPNTVNPDGNAGQAVSVKVQTPTDRCDRINPNDNRHCTILAYYTRDQRPLMQLDPWGLVFTPTSPGPLDATIKAFNPQLGRLLPGARIKSDDCGPWVTAKSIVPGPFDRFRAQVDFSSIPTDTTFTCNVIIAALMEEAGNPTDSTERSLEIVATRPPPDAITPEYPDLALLASAAQVTQGVLLYNFGAGVLNLVSVVAAPGTCPAGLLTARINPVRNLRLNDSRLTTAQADVQVNRAAGTAGTTCAGTVTITASGGDPVTIPVTIKVP